MAENAIGLVSPGEMGAAVGRSLTSNGRTVLSALANRSQATRQRAQAAGIGDGGKGMAGLAGTGRSTTKTRRSSKRFPHPG
jgi:hypothetical protein